MLFFWLPGKVGVQKGLSLGLMAAAVFVVVAHAASTPPPWLLVGWSGWILLVSAFVGYDMPSWSPLWRQDVPRSPARPRLLAPPASGRSPHPVAENPLSRHSFERSL